MLGRALDRKSTRLNSSHTEIYTLSLHDALPICYRNYAWGNPDQAWRKTEAVTWRLANKGVRNAWQGFRSEEHTSELQSHRDLHSFPTRRSSDLLSQLRLGQPGPSLAQD